MHQSRFKNLEKQDNGRTGPLSSKPLCSGKWLLRDQSVYGGNENLELDLNYMFRIPLWPITVQNSKKLG